ncbi:MAG: hypothetical protein ABIF19_19660 [Planctomycetota bacterium]
MKRNINCWAVALWIAVAGIFCICLPLAVWRGSVPAEAILKILDLAISWPLAILVISLVFFTRFQASLDYFLRNIRSFQFPGGNIQTQGGIAAEASSPGNIVLTTELRDQLIDHMAQLEQRNRDAAASQGELRGELNTVITHMFEWKFRYLSVFFVQGTKQILHWFAQCSPQSRASYNQLWQTVIPDANQRGIILDVLMQNGMLTTDGATISITPEGYGFLQFIGMIPYAPPQQGT